MAAGNGTRSDVDVLEPEAPDVPAEPDADAPEAEESTEPPAGRLRRRWPVAAAAGVVIVLVAVALAVTGRVDRSDPTAPGADAAPTAAPRSEPPETTELRPFRDPETGVGIAYPAGWQRLDTAGVDPAIRLVVSDGGLNSLLVRVVTLDTEITAENLADINSVTDGIIGSGGTTVLEERQIELDGLPGYYYLYLFDEPASGQQGVHAHYFLFDGRTMNILVFQAVPVDSFDALAPTFDAVAASFERP